MRKPNGAAAECFARRLGSVGLAVASGTDRMTLPARQLSPAHRGQFRCARTPPRRHNPRSSCDERLVGQALARNATDEAVKAREGRKWRGSQVYKSHLYR